MTIDPAGAGAKRDELVCATEVSGPCQSLDPAKCQRSSASLGVCIAAHSPIDKTFVFASGASQRLEVGGNEEI